MKKVFVAFPPPYFGESIAYFVGHRGAVQFTRCMVQFEGSLMGCRMQWVECLVQFQNFKLVSKSFVLLMLSWFIDTKMSFSRFVMLNCTE